MITYKKKSLKVEIISGRNNYGKYGDDNYANRLCSGIKEFIEKGEQIIYEATFQHNGVIAALDILVKESDGWKAYEVKSSTSVSESDREKRYAVAFRQFDFRRPVFACPS